MVSRCAHFTIRLTGDDCRKPMQNASIWVIKTWKIHRRLTRSFLFEYVVADSKKLKVESSDNWDESTFFVLVFKQFVQKKEITGLIGIFIFRRPKSNLLISTLSLIVLTIFKCSRLCSSTRVIGRYSSLRSLSHWFWRCWQSASGLSLGFGCVKIERKRGEAFPTKTILFCLRFMNDPTSISESIVCPRRFMCKVHFVMGSSNNNIGLTHFLQINL